MEGPIADLFSSVPRSLDIVESKTGREQPERETDHQMPFTAPFFCSKRFVTGGSRVQSDREGCHVLSPSQNYHVHTKPLLSIGFVNTTFHFCASYFISSASK